MKHILKSVRTYRKEVILGPLFKLLEAICELMVPLVMARLIDQGVTQADYAFIAWQSILLLVLALVGAGFAIVCQYYAARAAGGFGHDLRTRLYRHIMKLSDAETSKFSTGGLITRVTNDAAQVQTGLNMCIRLASRVPFLLIGSIVMAMVVNIKIGMIFLVSTPVIALVIYGITKLTLPQYGRVQAGQDALSVLARENLQGARVIRAFAKTHEEEAQFSDAGEDLTAVTVRVGKISALLSPLTTLIINCAIALVVWMGAQSANIGGLLSGEIIALVSYMNQTLLAMLAAAHLIVIFTKAIASARRVEAVLALESTVRDGQVQAGDQDAPLLSLADVCYRYEDAAGDALHAVSFTVEAGETVGIIGGTGSGKSTLAHLILRFFDVTKGELCVAGHRTAAYQLQALRQKIGFVPQKTVLLRGTIRSNLLLGCETEISDEQLWRCLHVAQAAEFVEKLPKGLDTVVEEGGKNFSGGQRQRLTIARALVSNPSLLILDDAASALDFATDAALRRALHTELSDMAVMIISQRASSLLHANKIVVLDEGMVSAIGTHDALLQSSALYREICQSQGVMTQKEGA